MPSLSFLTRPPIPIGIGLFVLLIASFLWMSNSDSRVNKTQLIVNPSTPLNIKGAFNGDTLHFSQSDLPQYLHPNADCIGKQTMGKFTSNIPNFWSAINTSTIPKSVVPGNYELNYMITDDDYLSKGSILKITIQITE